MEKFCTLAIDTVSNNPTASLSKLENNNVQIKSINLLKPSNTSSQIQRYDSSLFPTRIFELCSLLNVKPHQIKDLLYCSGPGPFSSIRVGVVISRILKRINPDLQVYKFNLLYLLYRHLKKEGFIDKEKFHINKNNLIILYMKAGIKDFFKEAYDLNTNRILEKAHLVNNISSNFCNLKENHFLKEKIDPNNSQGFLINPKADNLDFNLSNLMIELRKKENVDIFQASLNEIKPQYIKEASVTLKA